MRAPRATLSCLASVALVISMLPVGAGPLDAVALVLGAETATTTRSYPTIDADGAPGPMKAWRVSSGSGNCCENYLTATADGMLVNAGGGIRFSRDGGVTWKKVISPLGPASEGEGAVVAAPGGDVVAVGWNPYGGDRLQSFKYEAATDRWLTAEVPLHLPFFDRPWIGVMPGPFTIDGRAVPYVTLLRGAWPSKDLWMMSTDGLHYERFGNPGLEGRLGPTATVATGPLADLDVIQPHGSAQMTPLSFGGLARGPNCALPVLGEGATWGCGPPVHEIRQADQVLTDARGWLHAFTLDGRFLRYEISDDGGDTWRTQLRPLTEDLSSDASWDAKVSATAGIAAIAYHARSRSGDRDVVFRWDISTIDAPYLGMLHVGAGDLWFGGSITSTGPRYDFTSLAILPDGKIAVSFGDSEFQRPAIAIEL
jgi:hypothetical protein